MFHVLNARITFGNVNGCSTAEETVSQHVEGTQPDSGKKKSWILWFKKKFIHLIIILSIQFEIRVSYEVDFCPEWKKILDLVSIK